MRSAAHSRASHPQIDLRRSCAACSASASPTETEGSPYREVVISDEREGHVALLQRFKAHWLVQCGRDYGTTERVPSMTESLAIPLAEYALKCGWRGEPLVEVLVKAVDVGAGDAL